MQERKANPPPERNPALPPKPKGQTVRSAAAAGIEITVFSCWVAAGLWLGMQAWCTVHVAARRTLHLLCQCVLLPASFATTLPASWSLQVGSFRRGLKALPRAPFLSSGPLF